MLFAAKVADVPNFGKKVVEVDGRQVLLINEKGVIHAVENECPHQGSPLQAGIVKDGHLSCPRHGYRFDLSTGACLTMPQYSLATYPTAIEGEDIMIELP